MAVQVSYPGVYIDEFAPGAPIEGVGTSTAAFLGVNKFGTQNEPKLITSWDGFLREFWLPDPNLMPEDTDYLWYAVRGFFQNGGKKCYVIAVTNASPDSKVLTDMAGAPKPTIKILAREAKSSSGIEVKAEVQNAVQNGRFFKPSADIVAGVNNVVEVNTAAEASQFLAGDLIQVQQGGNLEPAVVVRTEDKLIRIDTTLQNNYTGGKVKFADQPANTMTFRADENAGGLTVGSAIDISQAGGIAAVKCRVTAIYPERISTTLKTYRITVDADVSGFDLQNNAHINIVSQEFKLTVKVGGNTTPYENLAMDPGHPRYFSKIINNDPDGVIYAETVEPPNTTPIPDDRPDQSAFIALSGGSDFDAATVAGAFEPALSLLARIDDINLVAAPGRSDQDIQLALIAHCENLQDRFALLDTPRGVPMFGVDGAEGYRPSVSSTRGYAALYYPWVMVTSAKSRDAIPIPPSGYMAGVYARIDGIRGVHKAPAGEEATVSGVIGVATTMSDDEQGILNNIGVNVIRVFQVGGRVVVWGARTTATNTNWRYVNIRRLFLFLEESIQEGINWAVFEPNNPSLWKKLKRTITAFLTQQWRDGALFGEKAEEAFYVRIDEDLNPDSQRALGRLYIEVGVRPSYPAEFIIVRIGIWQGGSEVSEG